jgi:hypothetical protein
LLDPCLALILLDSAFCQKSLSMLENKQDLWQFLAYLLDSRSEMVLYHMIFNKLILLDPIHLLFNHTHFLSRLQGKHIEEFHKMLSLYLLLYKLPIQNHIIYELPKIHANNTCWITIF